MFIKEKFRRKKEMKNAKEVVCGAFSLTKTKFGLSIIREGLPTKLLSAYFPIWADGKLWEASIRRLNPCAGGWTAEGSIKTPAGTWFVEDNLTISGNTLIIDRQWRWKGKRSSNVRLGLDLHVPFRRLDFWTIPYISINGNGGSKTVPSGMIRDGRPWVFREERTTAPGLMTLESDGVTVGTYTQPGRSEQTRCACSIVPGKGNYLLRTFFPYREAPRTFLGAGFPGNSEFPEQGVFVGSSGGSNGFVIEDQAAFRRKFFVVLAQAPERRHGYFNVWESAWRNLRDPIAPPLSIKRMENVLWRSLDAFWFQKGKVCGYPTRIDRYGDPLGGFSPTLGVGWCAPTMMLAWLAIRKAGQTGRTASAEKAIRATEFFVQNAGAGNGVFRTHFNLKTMRWSDGDLNAVQMGGAAYWLLRSVELLEKTQLFHRRIKAKHWRTFALAFCELAVRTQAKNGAFGAHWALDGRCLGAERAMGVHAARAVLEAYRHTGERRFLAAAERGANFYIRAIIDKETGYGDCTDLLNSTTENDAAGVPDFLIDLYRATGRGEYLRKAVRAAEYSLAYMFAYNVYFPSETECGRRKMRTRGSSAISPETAFISFFFAPQANAFLELWKETGERRWKDYAVAVVRGTLQMLSEPGDTFGLASSLVGCRAEVLPVFDTVKGQHVWKQGMTGYTWHQPVWWPAVFNLLNFAVVEDRFPEVLTNLTR
jgi:hypothetical protein